MAWLIKHTLNPVLQYSCDLWTIYFLDTRSKPYVHTRERWPFYVHGTDTWTLNGPNVSNQISKIACGCGIKRPLTPSLLFFAPTGIKTAKWCAPKSYFGTPDYQRHTGSTTLADLWHCIMSFSSRVWFGSILQWWPANLGSTLLQVWVPLSIRPDQMGPSKAISS